MVLSERPVPHGDAPGRSRSADHPGNGQSLEWNKPHGQAERKTRQTTIFAQPLAGGGARREKDADAVYATIHDATLPIIPVINSMELESSGGTVQCHIKICRHRANQIM